MTEAGMLELDTKIREGLLLSSKLLIEAQKKINGKLVVYRDGKIVTINAVDIK